MQQTNAMKNNLPTTHKVLLTFFRDEAHGEWGLAHDNAININESFNAFWSATGIFHDVYEHYFEGINKYFTGDYEFNIAGEVCAMGHFAYYLENYHWVKETRLNRNSIWSKHQIVAGGTTGSMIDGIMYGNFDFGNRLLSCVPKQKDANSYFLDNVISSHMDEIAGAEPKKGDNEYLAASKAYKRSITQNKIYNLYTYGYQLAKQIAPYSVENEDTIENFLNVWDNFCKTHEAKYLADEFESVEFTIHGGLVMSWEAEFIHKSGNRYSFEDVNNEEWMHKEYAEDFAEAA